MPWSYYLGYVIPGLFNEPVSLGYHKYIDLLIDQAHKDGFIASHGTGDDRRLLLTTEGTAIVLHFSRFVDSNS